MIPKVGEIWKHHKTEGEYEIIGIGKLQLKNKNLDMKVCVIYRALSDESLWVRPLTDFIETIATPSGSHPRFNFIRK